MGKVKYNTDEERKAAQKAQRAKWYQKNKDEILARQAEYKQIHKTEIAEHNAKYYQDHKVEIAEYNAKYRQSHKAEKAEYDAKYYQDHKAEIAEYYNKYKQEHEDEITEYKAKYYQKNRDKIRAQQAEYRSTPYGRANDLVNHYRRLDRKYNRGECTITDDWVVNNVFSGQVCHYCGESDWSKLGCDRKDSSLPHTPENCVPCCGVCNSKKRTTPYDEFMKRIGKIN